MKINETLASQFLHIIENLRGNLMLASESPRRCALLKEAGFEFGVSQSGASELIDEHLSPKENALINALKKARSVAERMPDALVIGADTLVYYNGEYFGKPLDASDAERILKRLSGTTHSVLTGVALVDRRHKIEIYDCAETLVTMKKVPLKKIKEYVESGEGFGKAGSYAIQDVGDEFIEKIRGSYTNVVGLPMELLKNLFEKYLEMRREKNN